MSRKSKTVRLDRSTLERMKIVAAQMSNVCFNYGQHHYHTPPSYTIDQRNLKMMFDLSKQWDAVLLEVHNQMEGKHAENSAHKKVAG
jgi:hypothetical protein